MLVHPGNGERRRWRKNRPGCDGTAGGAGHGNKVRLMPVGLVMLLLLRLSVAPVEGVGVIRVVVDGRDPLLLLLLLGAIAVLAAAVNGAAGRAAVVRLLNGTLLLLIRSR